MSHPTLRFRVPLVLASRSPRRKQLLALLGQEPIVHPSAAPEEHLAGERPEDMVRRLALDKAEEVAVHHEESLVLGADTVVVLDGQILGKPVDPPDACRMLEALSGRSHLVFSGVALIHRASRRRFTAFAETRVTFGEMSTSEIQDYVASGSPLDKAGSYGIQDDAGCLFMERIEGDYYNVVGLPMRTMYRLLVREFSDLL